MLVLVSVAAAALHSCTVSLVGPNGTVSKVSGYGGSEAEALADAEALAWTVADLRAAKRWWLAAFGWAKTTDTAVLRGNWVPGFEVTPSKCRVVKLEKSRGAWTATVGGLKATRPDAAVAARSVRRRACFSAYQEAFSSGFEPLASLEVGKRATILGSVFEVSEGALRACLDKKVSLQPVPGEPERASPTVCRALDVRRTGLVVSGLGVGPSLSAAQEAALWDHLRLRPRFALSEGLHAAAHASSEMRAALVAGAISGLVELVPPDPKGAARALSCQSEPGKGTLSWTPDPRQKCQDPVTTESWTKRTEACWSSSEPGLGLVNEALAHASPEHRASLQAEGIGVVLGCDALCEAGMAREGGQAVTAKGEPNFTTIAEAQKALDGALASGDTSVLLGLMPLGLHNVASAEGGLEAFMQALVAVPPEVPLLEMIDSRAWFGKEALRLLR